MSSPPKKRQRIAQACSKCRQAKLKCDGAFPACSKCRQSKKTCSYDTPQKKRGLRSGYVRAMEALLGIVLEQVESSQEVFTQMIQDRLHGDVERPSHTAFMIEDLAEAWRQSSLSRDLEQLIPRMNDADSDVDEVLPLISSDNGAPTTKFKIVPVDSTEASITQLAGVCYQGHYYGPSLSTSTILPEESLAWIDSYFANTHPWFPIIEKHHVYRTYYKFREDGTVNDPGQFSCLLAILAQSATCEVGQEVTASKVAPNTAFDLIRNALDLIPHQTHKLDLAHVQALLVASLAYMDLDRSADAWVLVGRAAQVLLPDQCLTDTTRLKSNISKDQGRTALAVHGCYILDCILATQLCLKPHMRDRSALARVKIDYDGIEEWSSADGLFRDPGKHAGPMLALSTFGKLAHAAGDLAQCYESDVDTSDEIQSLEITESFPHGSTSTSTPQQLSLRLLRLATMAEASGIDESRFCRDGRNFCQLYMDCTRMYTAKALPSICVPLWSVVLRRTLDIDASDRRATIHSIEAALSATPDSHALLSLKAETSRVLSTDQRKQMPVAQAFAKSLYGNHIEDESSAVVEDFAYSRPEIHARKRLPQPAGLGIQDVDFSLMPELEDDREISNSSLDQIMAQLHGTAVVPSASRPLSPSINSVVHGDGIGVDDTDMLAWDNDCDDSLQNLGYPILDGTGSTIHPLLNLPALMQ